MKSWSGFRIVSKRSLDDQRPFRWCLNGSTNRRESFSNTNSSNTIALLLRVDLSICRMSSIDRCFDFLLPLNRFHCKMLSKNHCSFHNNIFDRLKVKSQNSFDLYTTCLAANEFVLKLLTWNSIEHSVFAAFVTHRKTAVNNKYYSKS